MDGKARGSETPRVAVVLCAGDGDELWPPAYGIPKPLLRVGGKPVLGWNLEVLAGAGVEEVLINLHHKPEKIISYVGDGGPFGVSVRYYFEEEPLGTAGALDRMRERLVRAFLVVHGEVVLDGFPLGELFAFHRKRRGIGTVVLREGDRPGEHGLVELSDEGRIVAWYPVKGSEGKWEYAGICLLEPGILSHLPKGARWDLVRDLFPRVIESGETLWGFISPVEIIDVGSPEGLEEARRRFGA